MQGRKTQVRVTLTPEERSILLAWQRATTMPVGPVRRARVLLLLEGGESVSEVARVVGINRRYIYKWVQRFLAQGVAGLANQATAKAGALPGARPRG